MTGHNNVITPTAYAIVKRMEVALVDARSRALVTLHKPEIVEPSAAEVTTFGSGNRKPSGGWLHDWRSREESPLWKTKPLSWWRVWQILRWHAAYEPTVYENDWGVKVQLQPGELVMSLRELSRRARVPLQPVRNTLTNLQVTQQLTQRTTQGVVVLTLLDWDASEGSHINSNTASNTASKRIPTQRTTRLYKEEDDLRSKETPTPAREAVADIWAAAGWANPEEFEGWWRKLVENHPNRNANGQAKNMLVESVMSGTFKRTVFEAGYTALAEVNAVRWADEHGRYAPNLLAILQDRLWVFASGAKTNGHQHSRHEMQAQAEAEAFERAYASWLPDHPGGTHQDYADWHLAEMEREMERGA